MKDIKVEEIGILAIYVDGELTHIVKSNGDTKLYKVQKTTAKDYKDLLDSKNGIIKSDNKKDEQDD